MEDKNCTVVFCSCGCERIIFAAANSEIGAADIKNKLAKYRGLGNRIETATSDFVRKNWNEHTGSIPEKKKSPETPIQGSLF